MRAVSRRQADLSDMEQASYNPKHPHEPEIPPCMNAEGRCLVCGLMCRNDELQAMLTTEKELCDTACKQAEEAEGLLADERSARQDAERDAICYANEVMAVMSRLAVANAAREQAEENYARAQILVAHMWFENERLRERLDAGRVPSFDPEAGL